MLSKRALKWFCRFLVGVTLVLGVLAASSAYWQSFDLSYVRAVGMYISFFIFGLGAPLVLRHFNLRAACLLDERWHNINKLTSKGKSTKRLGIGRKASAGPAEVRIEMNTSSTSGPIDGPNSTSSSEVKANSIRRTASCTPSTIDDASGSPSAKVDAPAATAQVGLVFARSQNLAELSGRSMQASPPPSPPAAPERSADEVELARAEAAALVAAAQTARQTISSEMVAAATEGGRASRHFSNAADGVPPGVPPGGTMPACPVCPAGLQIGGPKGAARHLKPHDCKCRNCSNPHGEYAVICIQMMARRYVSYTARRQRLTRFEWPILLASLFWLFGIGMFAHANTVAGWADESEVVYHFGWFIFMVPVLVVLAYDGFGRSPSPQFSITHTLMYVSVLYRALEYTATFDIWQLNAIVHYFGNSEPWFTAAPLVSYGVHMFVACSLQVLGKFALRFVAPPNTHAMMIFPFQAFIYTMDKVLFNLIVMTEAVTGLWIAQQVVMQTATIITASGTLVALSAHSIAYAKHCVKGTALGKLMIGKETLGSDPAMDPLFKLQFLAALGVQYDIAIYTSVVMVPTFVSFFIWRDGYFTLEGVETIVFVTPDAIGNMWTRFAILAALQFFSLLLARQLLQRQMRLALLGKKTLHGTSHLASEIAGARQYRKGLSAQAIVNEALEKSSLWKKAVGTSTSAADREEIVKELALSNLNHATNYFRNLRRNYLFYICCLSLSAYSCFALRHTAPVRWEDQAKFNPTTTLHVELYRNGSLPMPHIHLFQVPVYMRWVYVPCSVVQTTSIFEDAAQDHINCTDAGWEFTGVDVRNRLEGSRRDLS